MHKYEQEPVVEVRSSADEARSFDAVSPLEPPIIVRQAAKESHPEPPAPTNVPVCIERVAPREPILPARVGSLATSSETDQTVRPSEPVDRTAAPEADPMPTPPPEEPIVRWGPGAKAKAIKEIDDIFAQTSEGGIAPHLSPDQQLYLVRVRNGTPNAKIAESAGTDITNNSHHADRILEIAQKIDPDILDRIDTKPIVQSGPIPGTVGHELSQFRTEHAPHVTLTHLAKAAGVSINTVRTALQGRSHPSAELIQTLQRELGVPEEEREGQLANYAAESKPAKKATSPPPESTIPPHMRPTEAAEAVARWPQGSVRIAATMVVGTIGGKLLDKLPSNIIERLPVLLDPALSQEEIRTRLNIHSGLVTHMYDAIVQCARRTYPDELPEGMPHPIPYRPEYDATGVGFEVGKRLHEAGVLDYAALAERSGYSEKSIRGQLSSARRPEPTRFMATLVATEYFSEEEIIDYMDRYIEERRRASARSTQRQNYPEARR